MIIVFYGYKDRIEPLCAGKDASGFLSSEQYRNHFALFDKYAYEEQGFCMHDMSYEDYLYEDGSKARSMDEYCKDHGIETPKGLSGDFWEVWEIGV